MEEVIDEFYRCFAALDAEGMAACYHDRIVFTDPAFGTLNSVKAGNMWRMLCASQQGKDFRVSVSNLRGNGPTCTADWEARYVFGPTGRPVHNIIRAHFDFEDGLIIRHIDDFDLHRWARQAMGWKGALLGGTGWFRRRMQARTRMLLQAYETRLEIQ